MSFGVLQLCLFVFPEFAFRAFTAQALSYSAGVLWSYAINSRVTFADADGGSRAFGRFVLVQLMLLLATAAAFEIATQARMPETRSWLAIMAIATIANFLISKAWVFQQSDDPAISTDTADG